MGRPAERLIWLANGPSPYNDCLFTFLQRNLESNLEVYYIGRDGGEHDSLTRSRSYEVRHANPLHDRRVIGAANDDRTRAVVGGWQTPLYLRTTRTAGHRSALWTDTPNIAQRRSPARRLMHGLATTTSFHSAGAIMGTGAEALRRLSQMGAPTNRLLSFPYFTEVPESPPPLPTGDRTKILSIGRLIDRKRFGDIVTVAKLLQGTPIEFTIIGDGPKRGEIEGAVRRHELTNVRLTGWQDPTAVAKAIREHHVLVHPAAWEPYGVVVLEAMAQGRPVVSSTGTMAGLDRINDRQNGAIYRTGNNHDLASVLLFLTRQPRELHRWSTAAHATARQWDLPRAKVLLKQALGPIP